MSVFLVAAATIPLQWPTIAPLTDLPGHMASYAVGLNINNSPYLHYYWLFNWHLVGNLGADLLIMALGQWLSVELATKLIVMMIPPLTVAGYLLVSRQIHWRLPATAALAVPLAYGYPFIFGFINYSLGLALALLGFAGWLALSGRWRTRAICFAFVAPVLWVVHAMAWGVLFILCATRELHRSRSLLKSALLCLPLFFTMPLILGLSHGPGLNASGWFNLGGIGRWALSPLRDRWIALDIASASLLWIVLGTAMLRSGGLKMNAVVAAPAGALFVAFLFLPQQVNGSDFFNLRLIPTAVALALLSIETSGMSKSVEHWTALFAAGFAVTRIGASTLSFFLIGQTWDHALGALKYIPRGSAVAAFVQQPCGTAAANWGSARFAHLPGLIVVRREGFVNSQWSVPGLDLLQARVAVPRLARDPSEMVVRDTCPAAQYWHLREALSAIPKNTFHFVWLLGVPAKDRPSDPRLRTVFVYDDTILFSLSAHKN